MKKFFSYILLFLLSVLFSVPLFLSVSEKISNMDEMMNMEQKNCIDHCLSGVYLEYSSIDSIFSIFPDVVQKIFILLTSVFGSENYFFVYLLLFGLYSLAPPTWRYIVKRKDFVSLIGIIKSST